MRDKKNELYLDLVHPSHTAMELAKSNILPFHKDGYSDAALVEGVLNGDRAAGNALAERFAPLISRRVRRLLGSDAEHADLVQQVFVQLVKGLATLDDRQALVDWVGRITVNVVRNELRRRSYRRIVGFSTERAEAAPASGDPELAPAVQRGAAVLEKMSVDDRIVFVLRYVEGCELKETARLIGCSLATAKRRIARARESFMKKAARDPVLAPWVRGDV